MACRRRISLDTPNGQALLAVSTLNRPDTQLRLDGAQVPQQPIHVQGLGQEVECPTGQQRLPATRPEP
jgi:hypothetical protein